MPSTLARHPPHPRYTHHPRHPRWHVTHASTPPMQPTLARHPRKHAIHASTLPTLARIARHFSNSHFLFRKYFIIDKSPEKKTYFEFFLRNIFWFGENFAANKNFYTSFLYCTQFWATKRERVSHWLTLRQQFIVPILSCYIIKACPLWKSDFFAANFTNKEKMNCRCSPSIYPG